MVDAQQVHESYNQIELQEKKIEPDKTPDPDLVTRNLQLGNIPAKDYKYYAVQIDRGVEYKEYPQERGGWLYKWASAKLFKSLNVIFIASNSTDGFLRISENTRYSVNKLRDDTPTKGMFSGFRSKEENR